MFVILLTSLLSTRAKLLEARGLLSVQFRVLVHMESWVAEDNLISFNEWNKYMQSLLLQYILWYEVKSTEAFFTLPEVLASPSNGLTEGQQNQIVSFLSEMEPFLYIGKFNYERFEGDVLMTNLPLFSNANRWANTPKARIVFPRKKNDKTVPEYYMDNPNYFVFPPLESKGSIPDRRPEINSTNIVLLQESE